MYLFLEYTMQKYVFQIYLLGILIKLFTTCLQL